MSGCREIRINEMGVGLAKQQKPKTVVPRDLSSPQHPGLFALDGGPCLEQDKKMRTLCLRHWCLMPTCSVGLLLCHISLHRNNTMIWICCTQQIKSEGKDQNDVRKNDVVNLKKGGKWGHHKMLLLSVRLSYIECCVCHVCMYLHHVCFKDTLKPLSTIPLGLCFALYLH